MVMNICRSKYNASDKTILSINTNIVLITILIDIKFLSNAYQDPFAEIVMAFIHSYYAVLK